MHLGNSIICPVTGVPMIAAMGAVMVWSFKKARLDFTKDKILPAVMLAAFIFCAQMINFTIPTTGSSGHIIGAVLLSIILGPYVAFLSVCSILLVQSLFFADGGISALGCNIFNMGFLACFAAYPLIYKNIENKTLACILASICALQFGSIAIAVEGLISGAVANVSMMLSLLCSIHLVIGIVEGVFGAVILHIAEKTNLSKKFSYSIGAISLLLASVISKYASTKPDGLEWSLINMSEDFVHQTQGGLYTISETIQNHTAFLSTMQNSAANVLGLFIVTILAFSICLLLACKKAEA